MQLLFIWLIRFDYNFQALDQMKEEVQQQFPDKSINVEYMLMDLASFRSTKDFTVAFKEKNLPLHILINNAAASPIPRSKLVMINLRS